MSNRLRVTQPRFVVIREDAICSGIETTFSKGSKGIPNSFPASSHDDGDVIDINGRGDEQVLIVDSECDLMPHTHRGIAVIFQQTEKQEPGKCITLQSGSSVTLRCVYCGVSNVNEIEFELVPSKAELFHRLEELYETSILMPKKVAVVGAGSGGSFIIRELVKSGLGRFLLVDNDRVSVGNVCRHELGLSDVGRLKTLAMRDWIKDRNPAAEVEVMSTRLNGENLGKFMDAASDADLLICATDSRASRLLVNRAAVLMSKICIIGGVMIRGCAGQVLRVVPGVGPCYQCFVSTLPELEEQKEVASEQAANRIAYADRPVNVEPGLSSDIAPVAILMTKLAILELIRGSNSTLLTMDKDLKAHWYLWVNRREAATQFENWEPMGLGVDQLSILRWYGADVRRIESCGGCGVDGTVGLGDNLDLEESKLFDQDGEIT